MSPDTEVPRGRRLKRAAGAAAAVAVLIVAQARPASASAREPADRHPDVEHRRVHLACRQIDGQINPRTRTDGTGPLHGEFPIVGVDGTVQIRRWQWGEVAALSARHGDDRQ